MEAIVTLHPTPKVIQQCLDLGIEAVSLKIRLVKVILDTGEKDVQAGIEKKTEGRKYEYQENRTSALFFVKEGLIALFTGASLNVVLTYLKEKIIKNILPIRPGRHYERRFTRYKLPKFIPTKRALA